MFAVCGKLISQLQRAMIDGVADSYFSFLFFSFFLQCGAELENGSFGWERGSAAFIFSYFFPFYFHFYLRGRRRFIARISNFVKGPVSFFFMFLLPFIARLLFLFKKILGAEKLKLIFFFLDSENGGKFKIQNNEMVRRDDSHIQHHLINHSCLKKIAKLHEIKFCYQVMFF